MMQMHNHQELSASSRNVDSQSDVEKYLHELLKQSEVLFPHEQAVLLAAAAAALNEPILLRATIACGFAYNATPLSFYEALLQTYLFAGFPAALEGLSVLLSICQERGMDFVPPRKSTFDESLFAKRGQELCQQIYTSAYDKMRRNLHAISPDLAEWMIVEGYGKTLSRPELPARIRELAVVAVLAVLGWNTQLYSHLRGAMNVGATPVECIDTLRIVSSFIRQVSSPMQPILQSRIAAAQATLTKLLDQSSKI
jgi:4-carboxymuconolactone decarboxylase